IFRTIDAAKYNFLEGVYIPGNYLIPIRDTALQISDRMIDRIKKAEPDIEQFLIRKIEWDTASKIALFVRQEIEKLPDLVPFPASDIRLETRRGRTLLLFSTKYWNKGAGPLEFVASKKSRGKTGSINRDIYQRIYRKDGGYRDKFAGNFFWHDEHLHYHFNDFVDYILQSVDSNVSLSEIRNKTTFCVRDKFRIKSAASGASSQKAVYTICGKEKQGISVGWSDIYDYTYADQNIDVTDVPTGSYKLTFESNPERRFDEKRTDNNVSSVLLRINAQEKIVEIIGEEKTI
ncbi:hypothetical protein IIA94_02835, partial [Patescibacteria group bacterium]|nr:hypothetical protein [Patescibacteria group bacterium]